MEEQRPGQYFPVEEDERGTYFFNSKDLCLLPHIAEILESGIDSLKIEGRMKGVHYVASVTKTYRAAIDSYFDDPARFRIAPQWREELDKVSHRAYTVGFYDGAPESLGQIYGNSSYIQTSEFVGLVESYDAETGWAVVEQRNNMKEGQEIEIFQPGAPLFRQCLEEMRDEDGTPIDVAPHAQQRLKIKMRKPVVAGAILRRPLIGKEA